MINNLANNLVNFKFHLKMACAPIQDKSHLIHLRSMSPQN